MAKIDRDDRQWTEEDARRSLAACARSGLSMRAFAMRAGLRPKRLYWWMKRIGLATIADAGAGAPRRPRRAKRSAESAPRFVPVVVKKATASAKAPIVIRHGESTTMEIESSATVTAAWVAAVMIELERAACW